MQLENGKIVLPLEGPMEKALYTVQETFRTERCEIESRILKAARLREMKEQGRECEPIIYPVIVAAIDSIWRHDLAIAHVTDCPPLSHMKWHEELKTWCLAQMSENVVMLGRKH